MKIKLSFLAISLSATVPSGGHAQLTMPQPVQFSNSDARKTAYILLVKGKDMDISFIDVHALQKPSSGVDVFNVELSERIGQQVIAMIPKLRAQGYRTLLIADPFRAATHNVVINNSSINIEVAGDSAIEENPAYYKAQQRLEVAEQRYETAKSQMQYTADSAQQSATGTTSRLLGATAIMMSGISASKYAEEVNQARSALAGTPRTIRVTQTRNVAVPRVVFEQGVVAELALSLCDLQARLCAQQSIPMNDSRQIDIAAIALKASKYYDTHLSRLQNFVDDANNYFNEKLATEISTEEMLGKFEGQSLTIPTATIMQAEEKGNQEYQARYTSEMEPRFEAGDQRAMNIKAQISSLQDPFDDPLQFAQYGDQQAQ